MAPAGADRSELVRALGAMADSPEAARSAGRALGLQPVTDAEHTDVFVLNLPPYASVYLGPDGALGGEGADRVGGFWRALGLSPPAEPDHLTALLGLYASLGEARFGARRPATRAALSRAQATLFWEHLHPWLPAYLDAVTDLPAPGLSGWASLLRRVVVAEAGRWPGCPALAAALRAAPAGPGPETAGARLAELLTIPVRSGLIITRRQLSLGAGQAGVGHRIGERRFTLRAMLEQDPPATRAWLAVEASRWQQRHESRAVADEAARWWAERARRTGRVLRAC
jgi:TorA maturation chaperone TorD